MRGCVWHGGKPLCKGEGSQKVRVPWLSLESTVRGRPGEDPVRRWPSASHPHTVPDLGTQPPGLWGTVSCSLSLPLWVVLVTCHKLMAQGCHSVGRSASSRSACPLCSPSAPGLEGCCPLHRAQGRCPQLQVCLLTPGARSCLLPRLSLPCFTVSLLNSWCEHLV